MRGLFDSCFRALRERFPDFPNVSFRLHEDAGDQGRHYAYCEQKPDRSLHITFAPDAAELSKKHIIGLMYHELGHAVDFEYPGRHLTYRLGSGIPRERERRADEIARRVFGVDIQYDPRIGYVQCVRCDGVSPRPRGLK